ncbi:MAG TPA: type II toxin-antitoxin system VapC family toxin [Bryobacteraceae bacterium]|jgi:tRNA(fMet)-specific endonuclease VapC
MDYQYLLDTNTASYIIKGNKPAVDRRLAEVPMARIAISAVTEGELRFGAERLPHAAHLHGVLEEFFLRVTVLPWDSNAARQYGHLRAALERAGRPMGNLDLMIAAHALALDLIVVTSDRAFRRIEKLKVEDWTKKRLAGD